MHAQATSAPVEGTISEALSKRLTAAGVEPQPQAFQARISSAGPAGVLEAFKTHVTEDLKIATDKAASIIEEGMKLLNVGSTTETEGGEFGTAQKPYIIESVREYKSRLAATPGPQPTKDLSEFEELDSKL